MSTSLHLQWQTIDIYYKYKRSGDPPLRFFCIIQQYTYYIVSTFLSELFEVVSELCEVVSELISFLSELSL